MIVPASCCKARCQMPAFPFSTPLPHEFGKVQPTTAPASFKEHRLAFAEGDVAVGKLPVGTDGEKGARARPPGQRKSIRSLFSGQTRVTAHSSRIRMTMAASRA
jgi:hypothetical protein